METERPFIVEVKDSDSENYVRNQLTFISAESADNWGFNFLFRDFRAEDYRVVDIRTGDIVIEGTNP